MRNLLGMRGVVAAVIAVFAAALIVTQVSAQVPTVKVTSATANPGTTATVNLQAISIGPPGLGAWEVGITYNTNVLTATACSPSAGSVCNADFAPGQVQVAGASGNGLLGTNNLAGISFRCNSVGVSDLNIVLDEFADSTTGSPRPIGPAINAGRITCTNSSGLPDVPTSPPSSTATPVPTADDGDTPAPTALPNSGGGVGGAGGSSTGNWLIAALATLGLVTVAAFGASRLFAQRANRD
jgi:hypothetical protein